MTTTNFTDFQTPILASWLNDVDEKTYNDNAQLMQYTPAGTGAVATTVQSKLRESVSVKDFGAVGDGVTDDYSAIQIAINWVAANKGGDLYFPAGDYIVGSGLILKEGVNLVGAGTAHYELYNFGTGHVHTGTVLLVTGSAGGDCIAFQNSQKGHYGIRNMSIFDNGTAAIRSIINITNVLHPRLQDTEVACLNSIPRGTGYYLGDLTLYGHFSGCVATTVLYGAAFHDNANANCFSGGSLEGATQCLLLTGTTGYPAGNSFNGVALETSYGAWGAYQELNFIANSDKVYGMQGAYGPGQGSFVSVYVNPIVKIVRGYGNNFSGCYIETSGTPASFNDGTNGTWQVLPVFAIKTATSADAENNGLYSCRMNVFLLDQGENTFADCLPYSPTYKSRQPVALALRTSSATVVATGPETKMLFNGSSYYNTNQITYNAATGVGTFRQTGLYMFSANVSALPMPAAASTDVYVKLHVAPTGRNLAVMGTYISSTASQYVTLQLNTIVDGSALEEFNLSVLQVSGLSANFTGYMTIFKIA